MAETNQRQTTKIFKQPGTLNPTIQRVKLAAPATASQRRRRSGIPKCLRLVWGPQHLRLRFQAGGGRLGTRARILELRPGWIQWEERGEGWERNCGKRKGGREGEQRQTERQTDETHGDRDRDTSVVEEEGGG